MNIGEYRATLTAQTQGQQDINSLSNAVRDLSAQVRQFAAEAGVGGNAAAQMAARAQAAGNAVTASAGQQRAGMQQLSYQLGDVAQGLSMATQASDPLKMAFMTLGQQGGQVVQALALMRGEATGLVGFLSGPWGAAVIGATAVLGPMIAKLVGVGEAAADAESALSKMIAKYRSAQAEKNRFSDAQGDLDTLTKERDQLTAYIAKHGVRGANGQMQFVYAQQQRLAEVNRQIEEGTAAIDAERVSTWSLDKVMQGLGETHKKHEARVKGVSSAQREAQRHAEALAKSEEALANAALRTAYAFDQKMRALDGNNSLATGIIGAEPIKPQTVTERLAADNTSELAKMGETLKGSPAKQAIESYGETISNVGKSAFDTWTKGLKGTEDALVNFAMTGKLSFKDLANSIIADLVRIAIQQTIMKSLTSMLGGLFADGAAFSGGSVVANAAGNAFSGGNVVPFASGGVVGRPMTFPMAGGRTGLMGEAGPEAIMPLRRMGNGRLGVETSGGASNVVVNVDASGSQVQGNNERANALGQAIAVAVRSELIQQKRPGGLLAAA